MHRDVTLFVKESLMKLKYFKLNQTKNCKRTCYTVLKIFLTRNKKIRVTYSLNSITFHALLF